MRNKTSKKNKKIAKVGIVYVLATNNNTIVTITDNNGNTLVWHSAGRTQKGARKATAHAGEEAAKAAGVNAKERGMLEVAIIVKGVGNGRDSAVRGVVNSGLKISSITDITPDPHAGCRRRKKRRG